MPILGAYLQGDVYPLEIRANIPITDPKEI